MEINNYLFNKVSMTSLCPLSLTPPRKELLERRLIIGAEGSLILFDMLNGLSSFLHGIRPLFNTIFNAGAFGGREFPRSECLETFIDAWKNKYLIHQ